MGGCREARGDQARWAAVAGILARGPRGAGRCFRLKTSMADILGLGLTHYPGLYMLDEDMPVFLRRTLSGKDVPQRVKNPENWPAEMRAEWSDDEGAAAARLHRERCFAAFRKLR